MAGCTHPVLRQKAAVRCLSQRLRAVAVHVLDLGLLRDLQCVIDFDSKVSHGTFQLGVTKQELHGCQ